jgi:hypothetical protein
VVNELVPSRTLSNILAHQRSPDQLRANTWIVDSHAKRQSSNSTNDIPCSNVSRGHNEQYIRHLKDFDTLPCRSNLILRISYYQANSSDGQANHACIQQALCASRDPRHLDFIFHSFVRHVFHQYHHRSISVKYLDVRLQWASFVIYAPTSKPAHDVPRSRSN